MKKESFNPPPQTQDHQPGMEAAMQPAPLSKGTSYQGSGKLNHKVAIITGGDSGIGKATSIAFAKEGCHVVIVYLNEHTDAKATQKIIEELGGHCHLIHGDLGDETFCQAVVAETIATFHSLHILVNNAAEQHPKDTLEDISASQLQKTFQTNVFSMFYLTKAALPYLKKGSAIINTSSITAYKGNARLLDYSASKGAIVSFTRSLALSLVKDGIRVNSVAPGPIWTPLIPSTFTADEVDQFGLDTEMGRPGQPDELAAAFVYLACNDSSYVTGQTIHVNGGSIING
ncbi:short-chain dehydrogenase/reductase SDR [Fictibacillus macauensis ZFHKF-1]|uniref:Short-chain dehydrogenase/reductase SDR n=1 Tax=Fictibacillus macauensis ZFHKF-1 TaxID=1196324 RepID=I8AGN8_9BACL|nr:SDR family oxidoreductase [Fictibacillus macauensis]EIT84559.1 short-chain dehydrogenase/reductase SDR [Fictibacillus macauensis ZFHKF-1]